MDYAALQTEIAGPAYTGLTDQQIVDALNAPITAPADVPIGDVVGYLAVAGKLAGVLGYAGTDPTTRVACGSFSAIIGSPQMTSFQCSRPATLAAVQAFLAAFVSAGLISSTDQTALLAMAQVQTTRARQLGFGSQCDMTQEIAAARKWG